MAEETWRLVFYCLDGQEEYLLVAEEPWFLFFRDFVPHCSVLQAHLLNIESIVFFVGALVNGYR